MEYLNLMNFLHSLKLEVYNIAPYAVLLLNYYMFVEFVYSLSSVFFSDILIFFNSALHFSPILSISNYVSIYSIFFDAIKSSIQLGEGTSELSVGLIQ